MQIFMTIPLPDTSELKTGGEGYRIYRRRGDLLGRGWLLEACSHGRAIMIG
jgi:hypothetical protein